MNSPHVDAAIARPTGHRFLLRTVIGIGAVTETGEAELGMRMTKSGRTTGVTSGTVSDLDFDGHGHTDQIIVERDPDDEAPISDGGDSGSVWLDSSNRIVGLHWGGDSKNQSFAIASPIGYVMEELGISFRDGVSMQNFIAITQQMLS